MSMGVELSWCAAYAHVATDASEREFDELVIVSSENRLYRESCKLVVGRIWHAIETSDIQLSDASDRIREHRERRERLEDAAADAKAILSQRRAVLDDAETIAAYTQDMSEFLNESQTTERRAFIETFVKEIVVMPGSALLRYTIPMPVDGLMPGRNAEEMALDGPAM